MGASDEADIKALFDKVSDHFAEADEGTRGMFKMLVATALTYRDTLAQTTGHVLTVAETRDALDAFMQTLKDHRIPPDLDKRVHTLVILWLEELKNRVHH